MSFLQRFFLILGFLLIFAFIIAYARGYRLNFKEKKLSPTGILAITSNPKAAKVFINDQFKGVTDINLNLPPGKYTIEIKKEGYTSWKKELILKGEWVLSVNGLLFPLNPSLSPLTNLGIVKAIPLDGTDKILIFSQKDNQETDGIYLFEQPKGPINFFPPLKFLTAKKNFPKEINFEEPTVIFSPDYKEAIIGFFLKNQGFFYLLSLNQENQTPFDISVSKDSLIENWGKEKRERVLKVLNTFPKEFSKIASDSFRIISFSPDENKVLYQPKKNLKLLPIITPPLIATNQTPQVRNLIKNSLYIYDKKEDKNYHLSEVEKTLKNLFKSQYKSSIEEKESQLTYYLQWFADSQHLVFLEDKKISIIDYDNLNKQIIYSGPFESSFFLTTSEGSLLVLTNLNPQTNQWPDLYAVGIK